MVICDRCRSEDRVLVVKVYEDESFQHENDFCFDCREKIERFFSVFLAEPGEGTVRLVRDDEGSGGTNR